MKDQLNNTLKVGDIVLHISSHGYLSYGVVAGFTDKMVRIAHDGNYLQALQPASLIRTDESHLQHIEENKRKRLNLAKDYVARVGDQSKTSAKTAKKSSLEI